jgi:type VI secretion system lysozyme-like protein
MERESWLSGGRTVLQRIRDPESANVRWSASEDDIRASILRHLRNMFATQVGSALACPEYGLVSMTDVVHSCPDALALVVESMRRTIERHEPRLVNVRVRQVQSEDDALRLRFDVSAQVMIRGRPAKMMFHTSIDTTRRIEVE